MSCPCRAHPTAGPAPVRRSRCRGLRRRCSAPPCAKFAAPRCLVSGTLFPVARFDAELYLRLLGEDTLLGAHDRSGEPFRSPLSEAAGALVAVGAVSAAKAEAVIDDYALARA